MGFSYVSRFTGEEIDAMLSAMGRPQEKVSCPNCGAPITGGVCEYCGTKNYNPAFDRLNRNGGAGGCGSGGAGVVWTYEERTK